MKEADRGRVVKDLFIGLGSLTTAAAVSVWAVHDEDSSHHTSSYSKNPDQVCVVNDLNDDVYCNYENNEECKNWGEKNLKNLDSDPQLIFTPDSCKNVKFIILRKWE